MIIQIQVFVKFKSYESRLLLVALSILRLALYNNCIDLILYRYICICM